MNYFVLSLLFLYSSFRTVHSSGIANTYAFSEIVHDLEELDAVMKRIEYSNGTFSTKEIYKFAILSMGESLFKPQSLEESVRALSDEIDRIVVYYAESNTIHDSLLDIIKEQQLLLNVNTNLQHLLTATNSNRQGPTNWIFLRSLKSMLGTYLAYLHRNLVHNRNQCIHSECDFNLQVKFIHQVIKKSRVLLIAAEAVMESVEELDLKSILGTDPVLAISAPENDQQSAITKQLLVKMARYKGGTFWLSFGTIYFIMSLIGIGIITPMMCSVPIMMLAQCMLMMVSFTGLNLVVVAAFIAFLRQEYSYYD